jgi:acyl-CoA thioesterase FadM
MTWYLGIAAAALLLLPILVFLLRFASATAAFARAHWFRGRLSSPLADSVLPRRAGFFDCDANLHVTNARYLSLVDLARFDLLARLGFFPLLARRGHRILLGSTCMRFRRDVPLFGRFSIRSRLLAWDEKWFYNEHLFEVRGRAAVVVLAKFLVVDGSREKLSPCEALRRMMGTGGAIDSPPVPERAAKLLRDSDPMMSPD